MNTILIHVTRSITQHEPSKEKLWDAWIVEMPSNYPFETKQYSMTTSEANVFCAKAIAFAAANDIQVRLF